MDRETNRLNILSAKNEKILTVETRCFPVLNFIWGERFDLNVVRDVIIPNQLSNIGELGKRRGFTCYRSFWGYCYEIS